MDKASTEELQNKLEITYAAVDLYVDQEGEFTLSQIAERLDLTVADIFDFFSDKRSILEFYYTSLVIRYRMMIEEIDDFQSYSLSEKLSNFAYASFDMMEEKQAFVASTYRDIVLCSYTKTGYAAEVASLFEDFFSHDENISASSTLILNKATFSLLGKKYQLLNLYWLKDESDDKEQTMELTDKFTSFIEEIMYTKVADKGIELLKFFLANNFSKNSIPFWDSLTSKIEIKS